MPVQLGLIQFPISVGRDRVKEKKIIDIEYRERWEVARRQLGCMRVYLYYIGKFFAAQLAKKGHIFKGYGLADYVNSEHKALSLGPEVAMKGVGHGAKKYSSPPYPTLYVDMNKARRKRGGQPVSWVFRRLYELSLNPVFVQVWDAPQTPQAIGGKTDYESQKKKDKHFDQVDYLTVKVHYQDPRKPKAAYDKRGETYVHELVIHAWRHAQYGALNASYRYQDHQKKTEARKAHLYYLYGHHRGGAAHVLDDKSLPHSRADIEADLLWFYFKKREQLNPRTKRRRHTKGEFNSLIRSIGGDSLMCRKLCRLPKYQRTPGSTGRKAQ